jgi:spore maturation protein CgeB
MRILYVAMQYDYGDPTRGESFEEANFFSALQGMGHELIRFDFMARKRELGKRAMRRELIDVAESCSPDVCFFVLFGPELDGDTVREVGRRSGAPTVNWFADDHWRFRGFTDRLGPAFDWCVTTDEDSLPRYADAGISNVILSQWACNRYVYEPTPSHSTRGVTFVGRAHSDRPEIVQRAREAGFDVECWGRGWPNGRVSTSEMVDIFSTSTINLNLANSSKHPLWRVLAGRMLGYGGSFGERPPQIKGRTFEIPGCGGFQLTEYVPHLERYFELEREVSVYRTTEDLIERIAYWINNPEERRDVAAAGYRRVMAEHTYDHRFASIFASMGLS